VKANGTRVEDLAGTGLVTRQRWILPLWASVLALAVRSSAYGIWWLTLRTCRAWPVTVPSLAVIGSWFLAGPVTTAAFGCLRWGELAALTRKDLDVEGGWIYVRNTLVELMDGSLTIGPPTTDAGRRVVAVPRLLIPEIRAHLGDFTGSDPSDFVFVGPKGGLLRRSNFQKHWRAALRETGLEGVHFHDLRHTGNTLAAQSGATLADLMARMGHSSTRAALIYLHTNSARDRAVAASLEELLQSGSPVEESHTDGPDDPPSAVPVGPRIGHATGTDRLQPGKNDEGPGRNHSPARAFMLERVTRIELALSAWEADVLPLNYTRIPLICRNQSPTRSGAL
jgi:hypothetical protein